MERGRRIAKWRFFKDVNNDLTPKMIRGIKERVRNSFVIKHTAMPISFGTLKRRKQWPIFRKKDWFDRISEVRQWLEEQEENRIQSENIVCVAKVGKEELQDIQWMVFVGKQTRCSSSMTAIGRAVHSVFQDGERKLSLSKKTKQSRRGLTREMQFVRTLDRRRAILEEDFELIECWEHDFKGRPLYPKKKTETFPPAIVFDIEALLDTSKCKQAMKDLLF